MAMWLLPGIISFILILCAAASLLFFYPVVEEIARVKAEPIRITPPTHLSPPPPPPSPRKQPRSSVVEFAKPIKFGKPNDGISGPAGDECRGHGIYNPTLHECRCTAGWGGRFCEVRRKRPCNYNTNGGTTNADSLCAGNCDEDRGHCYCAGLATPFQRPLQHYCAPWAHRTTKLPDGRPAYPVLGRDGKTWEMARLNYERPNKDKPWLGDWARYFLKPFDAVYGHGTDNPPIPDRRNWPNVTKDKAGWCEADASTGNRRLALNCNGCYEGRTGKFCEEPKRSYCLRDCMGHGTCDSGFCWCEKGYYGIDCSQSSAAASAASDAPPQLSRPTQQATYHPARTARPSKCTCMICPPTLPVECSNGVRAPRKASTASTIITTGRTSTRDRCMRWNPLCTNGYWTRLCARPILQKRISSSCRYTQRPSSCGPFQSSRTNLTMDGATTRTAGGRIRARSL